MARVLVALVLAVALLTSCDGANMFAPEISAPEAFEPPDYYRVIWAEVAACTESTRSFDEIQWFEASKIVYWDGILNISQPTYGMYQPPSKITMLTGWTGVDLAVRHELVHFSRPDLQGIRAHGYPLFQKCAVL